MIIALVMAVSHGYVRVEIMVLCYDVPRVAQICDCLVCVIIVAWLIHMG